MKAEPVDDKMEEAESESESEKEEVKERQSSPRVRHGFKLKLYSLVLWTDAAVSPAASVLEAVCRSAD